MQSTEIRISPSKERIKYPQARPLTSIERLGLEAYQKGIQFPWWYALHGEQNLALRKVLDGIANGEKSSLLSDDVQNVFREMAFATIDTRHLPQDESGYVLAFNHYDRGPLRGLWQPVLTARAIHEASGGTKNITAIIESNKDWIHTIRHRVPDPVYRMFYNRFEELAHGQINPVINQIMANFAHYMDIKRAGTKEQIAALKMLRTGGVVITSPTADEEYEIGWPAFESGRLFDAVLNAKKPQAIVPSVGYTRGNKAYIRFGQQINYMPSREELQQYDSPYVYSASTEGTDNYKVDHRTGIVTEGVTEQMRYYQQLANFVSSRIAAIAPVEMQGVFGKKPPLQPSGVIWNLGREIT